jgi:hypothetical protein
MLKDPPFPGVLNADFSPRTSKDSRFPKVLPFLSPLGNLIGFWKPDGVCIFGKEDNVASRSSFSSASDGEFIREEGNVGLVGGLYTFWPGYLGRLGPDMLAAVGRNNEPNN